MQGKRASKPGGGTARNRQSKSKPIHIYKIQKIEGKETGENAVTREPKARAEKPRRRILIFREGL